VGAGEGDPLSDDVQADYSQIADAQLDQIEASGDSGLYNAILDICELVFTDPDAARRLSTAITTTEGIRMRLPVSGHYPYKVFWSLEVPRVEAVFPYEPRFALPE
jgi:hypothetical protein